MKSGHHCFIEFDAAWKAVIRPWFESQREDAWRQVRPVVVTCPNAAFVAALKQRLAEENIPAFGIHFTSPGTLRRMLNGAFEQKNKVALREDLHLLARVAAESDPDLPLWKSVAAEPSSFIRAFDALDGGGWSADGLADQAARRLAEEIANKLGDCGLMTVRQADRSFGNNTGTRVISNWMALGFSSGDWPEFQLLKAAYKSSEHSMLCFRAEGERPAPASWTGSWEEIAGPVEDYLGTEAERHYTQLADDFASHSTASRNAVTFHIAHHLETEATFIVREIKQHLLKKDIKRIAVVLPRRFTTLGREVALKLAEAEIPHHDQAGHRPAQSAKQSLFSKWIHLQQTQRLSPFLDFSNALTSQGLGNISEVQSAKRHLVNAFQNAQTEQLNVLSALVDKPLKPVMDWPLLPADASFAEFSEVIAPQLERIGWPEDQNALLERIESLAEGLAEQSISRNIFLKWLTEVADIPGRSRAESGRQPFAPVQILTLDEASGQDWDCVILAGMTHGEWPPESPESAFLTEARIRELNRRALKTGSQGEGQEVVANDRTLIPGAVDDATRREELLTTLVASTRKQVIATVSLRDPMEPSMSRGASEWIVRLIAADRDTWPNAETLEGWAVATETAFKSQTPYRTTISFSEIQRVNKSRSDSTKPFDAYSFGFESPPEGGLVLSASQWENIFNRPATVWYQSVLMARPPEDFASDESSAVMARGTWTHAWLNPTSSGEWRAKPSLKEWTQQIEKRANTLRAEVAEAFSVAERALPAWWLSDWSIARRMALDLAAALVNEATLPSVTGEYTLPNNDFNLVPGILKMPLRGRIDLLLSDRSNQTNPCYQIVDFKTGSHQPLSITRLAKGEGIQAALYALAIRSIEGASVSATILKPGDTFTEQITDEDAIGLSRLWAGIATIHQKGQLGDLKAADANYGFAPQRPLAEIAVPKRILDAKWRLTHPDLVEESNT
ncbi:PD-(D/E)XK nuclease family protein [Rubellicoccus peritrichatus]|uniref:PD-(D/E)XK nuclease family protein n=1 Tax=Rubellicoccus peritrichatus TaxID=3080537 RepID=A0AAQ3L9M4_9BACT|nr:PD-(D/E)XK nuclease family protein [Puniceicoccus sp. CR14]WOO41915.1 PD-(D/E)XK nuclease family protein [Puniceicoccus sp. CR14]